MVVDTSGMSPGRDDCFPKRQIQHKLHKKERTSTTFQQQSLNSHNPISIGINQYLILDWTFSYHHIHAVSSGALNQLRLSRRQISIAKPSCPQKLFSHITCYKHQDLESFYLRILLQNSFCSRYGLSLRRYTEIVKEFCWHWVTLHSPHSQSYLPRKPIAHAHSYAFHTMNYFPRRLPKMLHQSESLHSRRKTKMLQSQDLRGSLATAIMLASL